jgi:hypothetical protein
MTSNGLGRCVLPGFRLPALPYLAHSEQAHHGGSSLSSEDEQAFCEQHQTVLMHG